MANVNAVLLVRSVKAEQDPLDVTPRLVVIVEGLDVMWNVGVAEPGPPETVKALPVEQLNKTRPDVGVTVPTSTRGEHGVNPNCPGTVICGSVWLKSA